MSDTEVIDLDSLQPKPVIITWQGTEIKVSPPTTGDILRLGTLAAKLETMAEDTPETIDANVADVTAQIHKMIPGLVGAELNTMQLLVLVKAMSDMAIPGDMKALKAKGITVGDPKAPKG